MSDINPADIKIVFMGTPEFASECLRVLHDSGYNVVLAVTQPDKPVGRKHVLTPPPVKVLAESLAIPVYQPSSFKDENAAEEIVKVQPDLIVTAAYGKILPQRVLDIPKFGSVNIHGSLLPAKRGAAPVQRAVLEGDEKTGVTLMLMDAGMDTGDMLASEEYEIPQDMHAKELMEELAKEGAALLVKTLPGYLAGTITPVPQDNDLATYSPPIEAAEGLIDWSETALAVHNRIRALSEWPGAYTFMNGKKLKIYDSKIADTDTEGIPFGKIIKPDKKTLIVSCGTGAVRILTLQQEGGKVLPVSDIAHNIPEGTMLGE
ncbi:MAG: methionyl-tRNA formyltransferase [Clostridiales bacterium]|nr:methionyl-tRNA formyltransferase [Clostridiales bacterium]